MKPKVAFYWCASCGGCEEAVLDVGEQILEVTNAVDIVFWPVALDFKENDVEAMPDASIAISFINGAVRTTGQEEMARLLRTKSKLVVAFGACAQLGGIPGLANMSDARGLLQEVYGDGVAPKQEYRNNGHTIALPKLFDTVFPLYRVISVDYYVPGCPPTPKIFMEAVEVLLSAELPEKGAVLAPDRALCEECPRRDTRPQDLHIEHFRRVHETVIDPQLCLFAQGFLCLGPATRAGCEARCILGNMPCTGCFGPTSRVRDFGGKAMSAIASSIAADDDVKIEQTLDSIPDPVGTFYRYSLPSSFLQRKRLE
jgi:F420-non-reducing hydrogenase small subunit